MSLLTIRLSRLIIMLIRGNFKDTWRHISLTAPFGSSYSKYRFTWTTELKWLAEEIFSLLLHCNNIQSLLVMKCIAFTTCNQLAIPVSNVLTISRLLKLIKMTIWCVVILKHDNSFIRWSSVILEVESKWLASKIGLLFFIYI